jgi:hypothetical protein
MLPSKMQLSVGQTLSVVMGCLPTVHASNSDVGETASFRGRPPRRTFGYLASLKRTVCSPPNPDIQGRGASDFCIKRCYDFRGFEPDADLVSFASESLRSKLSA